MSSFYSRSKLPQISDDVQHCSEGVRRVNQAVFISRDHQSRDSENEDSDSCSVASTLTSGTLKMAEGYYCVDYDSDSSTTTTVAQILSNKRQYDPRAYDKWLKAKIETERKRKESERMRQRREEAKKKMEAEKRKLESEEKLKRWMERKEQEEQKKKKQQEKKKGNGQEKSITDKKWLPNDESVTNFNVWLSRVKQQEEQAKLRQLAKQRIEEEFKNQRQDLSKMFYDEWLKSVKDKPKPVPLNRGTESLRGTISKIFINPNPWQVTTD
ncbi:coiled-coil domain-containing protein 34-like [Topomyia yanbarensis]|uniref:coiled-coil domain-containing protein 34-like n=1 Tax=Topomyia yanbarensis TaxID=2498891 RepID=UPI00273CA5AD|nr:coiled-coil domain-containing protein 34-like [Topomyia yanbarensis]